MTSCKGFDKEKAGLSEDETSSKEIEKRLLEAAVDHRIECAEAFALAESLAVPPHVIGRTADKLKIRICSCQLGCF